MTIGGAKPAVIAKTYALSGSEAVATTLPATRYETLTAAASSLSQSTAVIEPLSLSCRETEPRFMSRQTSNTGDSAHEPWLAGTRVFAGGGACPVA